MVKEAAKEVKVGKHVQLDWPLHNIEFPGFGRIPCGHKVKDLGPEGFVGFDDELHINTQTSSQWDGLKHVSISPHFGCFSDHFILQFGIQKQKMFYNGISHEKAGSSTTLGTHSESCPVFEEHCSRHLLVYCTNLCSKIFAIKVVLWVAASLSIG